MGKSICLLILLLGIVMMTIGYTKKMIVLDKSNKIEYRLIPDNFYEQQFSNQDLTSLPIFKNEKINNNKYNSSDQDFESSNSIFDYNLSNFIVDDN